MEIFFGAVALFYGALFGVMMGSLMVIAKRADEASEAQEGHYGRTTDPAD